jgi:AcrR family transcriptional regulator
MKHYCLMSNIRPKVRDAIIEAAFQVYTENPKANLAEIAEWAGIGRATLHRYFKGRGELFYELAKQAVRELDRAALGSTEGLISHTEALKRRFVAMVPLAGRQLFLAREVIEDHPEIREHYRRQKNEMLAAVKRAKQEGHFDEAIPTSWIVQIVDHLIFAAWEAIRDGELTLNQASELAWRTLNRGMGGY